MENKNENRNFVLVIEDSDTKWREINDLVLSVDDLGLSVERAKTMEEANKLVGSRAWDLILLDISMDIRSSDSGPGAGGHDPTGGLKIAERMYYLGYDAPIVIVTAFDAFPANIAGRGAILGLDDVVANASKTLGNLLVGWVRYAEPGWAKKLAMYIRKAIR